MITKTISYVDYNGTARTDDFYFNLNHVEFLRLQESMPGGFQKAMEKAMLDKNSLALLDATEKLIQAAYGKKSDDGVRFMKNDEILKEFTESEAYPMLLMELTEKGAGKEFIKGLFSKSMGAQVELLTEAEELLTLDSATRQQRIGMMDADKRKIVIEMLRIMKAENSPQGEVVNDVPDAAVES